jgi:hypothetical protein
VTNSCDRNKRYKLEKSSNTEADSNTVNCVLFVIYLTKLSITQTIQVGFEVLTAVSMKMAVFWVVAPCCPCPT